MNTHRKNRLLLGLRPPWSSLAVGLFVWLFVVSAPTTALWQEAATLAKRGGNAVVILMVYDYAGSVVSQRGGFFFTDGRIVTNPHVVEDAARVDVLGTKNELLGSVSYAESLSSRVDVGILPRLRSVPGSLEVAPTEPRIEESSVVIGAPLGFSHTVANGIGSAERRLEGATMVQFTAPISSGSSGGPGLTNPGTRSLPFLNLNLNLNLKL